MSINRRQLLKALGCSSLLSLGAYSSGIRLFGPTAGSCNCVNILLHGFFFMEFQKENGKDILVIASPKFKPHQFYYRDHGKWQLEMLKEKPVRWTNDLAAGSKNIFPDQVLYFSKKDIDFRSEYFIDRINKEERYACVLILPVPKDIIPLRLGQRKELSASGTVYKSIKGRSNSKHVSLVTRLKFDATNPKYPPFKTRNYFAEHCHRITLNDVNEALCAAKDAFGREFQLKLTDFIKNPVKPDNQQHLPDEISPEDELAMEEGNPCVPKGTMTQHCKQVVTKDLQRLFSMEVATCPQFGVGS